MFTPKEEPLDRQRAADVKSNYETYLVIAFWSKWLRKATDSPSCAKYCRSSSSTSESLSSSLLVEGTGIVAWRAAFSFLGTVRAFLVATGSPEMSTFRFLEGPN